MSRRKRKSTPKIIPLDTLLEEVKAKMGENFYNELVKSIDEQKWEYYHDGERQGYSSGIGAE